MKVFLVYTLTHSGIDLIHGVYANKSRAEEYVKQRELEHWNILPEETKTYFQNDIINYPSNFYINEYEVIE